MKQEEMEQVKREVALICEIDVLRAALHKIATGSEDRWAVELATEALLKGDAILIEGIDKQNAN
jgi:hypothetical protein